jgi:hypothetical protein
MECQSRFQGRQDQSTRLSQDLLSIYGPEQRGFPKRRTPGNKEGKTLTKSFKNFQTGSPEEWILWRTDCYEVCTGMLIATGSAKNLMVYQMLLQQKQMQTTINHWMPLQLQSSLPMPTRNKKNTSDKACGNQKSL